MRHNTTSRLLMLLAMFIGTLSAASADDRFFVDAVNIEPGETIQLTFNLENSQEFFGFQADINLPDGLEIVMLNGKPDFKLSSRANSSYAPVSNKHSFNNIRIGAFSTDHTPISGNSGALVYLNVRASDTYMGGTLSISEILFTNVSNNDVKLPDFCIELGTRHNDKFYIPDFKIAVGETKDVPLVLDNETPFTAFQTDIYLPEGLVLANANPTLTSRASDHTLSAKAFSDGRIRIASLSLSNTVVAGNSGALVTLSLTATKDVAESCSIEMKNQRFTMPNAKEYILPNSTTAVTTERALVETINLNETSISMVTGETFQLSAEVLPIFASTKDLTWSSSNPDIATISESGLLTAIAPGNAVVTATAVDGSGVTAICEVAVTGVPVSSISINRTTTELKVTESVQLSAIVLPANAYDKTIDWSSGDETIATVDSQGLVTALKEGDTQIIATSISNPETSAICHVIVIPTPVSSIELNLTEVSLEVGQTRQVKASVSPQTATAKEINWRSTDANIASVDAEGVITAVALGSTTIIAEATDGSGVSAVCTVNVVPTMATGIEIVNSSSDTFRVGETIQLTAIVTPENSTDKSVTWAVSNSDIAIVDATGLVIAKSVGEVTVKATNSAGITDEITLNVVPTLAESITIRPSEVTLRVGQSAELMATVLPLTTTNKILAWSSSDENIVTVSSDGVIVATGLGEAEITTTTTDGSDVSASVKVTVEPTPATGISIVYDGKTTLCVGEKVKLSAIVSPDDATDKSTVWHTQSAEILSVDNDGVVTAIGLGEAWISATNSAGQSAYVIFNVVPTPVIAITLNSSEISLKATETFKLIANVLPDDATDKGVSFASLNTSVATVDSEGVITAVNVGQTEIIVSANDASGVTTSCNVKVIPTLIESIAIVADGATTLKASQTVQLRAEIFPSTTTDKTFVWTSDNEAIASVDALGLVTANSVGKTRVKATSGNKFAEIEITVEDTLAESITLNLTTAAMKVTGTMQLFASFTPETTTNKSVIWSSSNPTIASVNTNGVVTANALGDCIITATTTDGSGVTDTCAITVGETAAESVTITPGGSFTLRVGDTKQFGATVYPETTTDKSVIWLSQTAGVIVDQTGLVTAVAPVENNWVQAINSAGQIDMVYITVLPILAESIDLNLSEITLKVGETANILATVKPENATNKAVNFRTSTPEFISVSPDGEVTALAIGEGVVNVSANDGSAVSVTAIVHVIPTPTESIIISEPATVSFKVGQSIILSAIVLPENATDRAVVWSSSDDNIATVSNNGIVTAIAVSNVVITAKASGGQTASVNLTVIPTLAESIYLDRDNVEMKVDENTQLSATIVPTTTTNKQLTWTSSAPDIVSVDETGQLVAHALGKADISVATVDGSNLTAKCSVNVVATPAESVRIIYDGPTTVNVGFSTQLRAEVYPSNTTDKSIEWFSQNDNIIRVESDGLITATGTGETQVGVSTANGMEAYLNFRVVPNLVESIELSTEKTTIKVGETTQISASVLPDNTTNKALTWESKDNSIATVSQDGIVTGISIGKVDIIAHATDGSNVIQMIRINVIPTPVESIDILATGSTTLKDGETVQLIATVYPESATNKSITWHSDNELIATVDQSGIVKAHSVLGTTQITATSNNGVTASIEVNVIETPVESINIYYAGESTEIMDGESIYVYANFMPETATNAYIEWSVSDPSIISFEDGTVTGLYPGEAYVIAMAPNGVSASLLVTVKPILIESIEFTDHFTTSFYDETGTRKQMQLNPQIYPANASIKSLHWTSSNELVGMFVGNVFWAISPGTTTLTCYSEDGSGVTATCEASFIIPVTGVTLSEHNVTLNESQTFELTAQIEPSNVTYFYTYWNSSNEDIASVEDGVIEAKSEGKCTISVLASSGLGTSFTDECLVTVSKESGIETITVDGVSIKVDGTQVVVDNVSPGASVSIYTLTGVKLQECISNDAAVHFDLQSNNFYIISIGKYALKVFVK